MLTTLWNDILLLPTPRSSRRISFSGRLEPGQTRSFRLDGQGCVKHWWFTQTLAGDPALDQVERLKTVHRVNLQIAVDGNAPAVDQPLPTFFGTFLDLPPVMLDSAPLTVLRRNAFNCWLPMPFASSVELRLRNDHELPMVVWLMLDAHLYAPDDPLTDLRLTATYRKHDPAPLNGEIEVGRALGRGFVAGLLHGTDARSENDAWYHTAGDTWLLDAETEPMVLCGNGGEDVVGYSFGIHRSSHLWQGCHYTADPNGIGRGRTPCCFYRFFGPDALIFNTSMIGCFGTQAARVETTLFCYQSNIETPQRPTVPEWQLCGPFDGSSFAAFDRAEFPETSEPSDETFDASHLPSWSRHPQRPDEPAYRGRWVAAKSDRGWVDFLRCFRGVRGANHACGGEGGAAYATGILQSRRDGHVTVHIGFDDWLKLWVNGRHLGTWRHEQGFERETIRIPVEPGPNRLLIKLSNSVNREFLCWAFHLAIQS